jgi:hypothetical protein
MMLAAGTRLGNYEILSLIGAGGMDEVLYWRVHWQIARLVDCRI